MQHAKRIGRQRKRRAFRVRNKIKRVSTRARLNVFRSLKHFAAQVIDDQSGRTLAAASTLERELKEQIKSGGNKAAAALVGKVIAQRALEKGITEVALDRREYKYHGRIAAMAGAAREAGLQL
ncbi:MAG: 50S ribosomal protein L18 [Pirellulales bacterium]|nr:50S ribosomal protein L18 [Pirellulales bacterium]